MLEAILDTNFLMLAYQFKVDIFSGLSELLGGYRAVTCKGVVSELRKLGSRKGNDAAAARYALRLIRLSGVEVKDNTEDVDEWIVRYCKMNGATACTVDKELRDKLKKEGVKVVILRGKSHLQVV